MLRKLKQTLISRYFFPWILELVHSSPLKGIMDSERIIVLIFFTSPLFLKNEEVDYLFAFGNYRYTA